MCIRDSAYAVSIHKAQGLEYKSVKVIIPSSNACLLYTSMLGICKTEDCLVLMDEPDAYMNPRWKYEIKETMDKSLQDAVNTQAIVATHDPLVINGVPKEFIRIFTRDESLVSNNGHYFTKVIVPTEDTEGMGIDGLLQSCLLYTSGRTQDR